MNDSLSAKLARNPLKFGLIFGFLGVPIGWALQNAIFTRIFTYWPTRTLSDYFAASSVFGAILGGCAFQVWANWNNGKISAARYLSIVVGLCGALFWGMAQNGFSFTSTGRTLIFGAEIPFWFGQMFIRPLSEFHLPFYLALLLFVFGIFAKPQH